jgi:hypothetical protein
MAPDRAKPHKTRRDRFPAVDALGRNLLHVVSVSASTAAQSQFPYGFDVLFVGARSLFGFCKASAGVGNFAAGSPSKLSKGKGSLFV